MKNLLNPDEAAKILGVGKATVLRLLKSGKLRGQKLGFKTWRIVEDDLVALVRPQLDKVILCDRTLLLKVASKAMRKQIIETIMRERETAAQICESFGNQEAANAIRCQREPKFVNTAAEGKPSGSDKPKPKARKR